MIAILLFASITVSSIARPIPKTLNCTDIDIEEINNLVENLNLENSEHDIMLSNKEWEKLRNLEKHLPEGKLKNGFQRILRLVASVLWHYAKGDNSSLGGQSERDQDVEGSRNDVIFAKQGNRITSDTVETDTNIISDSSEHTFKKLNGLDYVIPHETPPYFKLVKKTENERPANIDTSTKFPIGVTEIDTHDISFEMQPSGIVEHTDRGLHMNELYRNKEETLKVGKTDLQSSGGLIINYSPKFVVEEITSTTKAKSPNEDFVTKRYENMPANIMEESNTQLDPEGESSFIKENELYEVTNLVNDNGTATTFTAFPEIISVRSISTEAMDIPKTVEFVPAEGNIQTTSISSDFLKKMEPTNTELETNFTHREAPSPNDSQLLPSEMTTSTFEIIHKYNKMDHSTIINSDTVNTTDYATTPLNDFVESFRILRTEKSTILTINEDNVINNDIMKKGYQTSDSVESSTPLNIFDEFTTIVSISNTDMITSTKKNIEESYENINLKNDEIENNFLKFQNSSDFLDINERINQTEDVDKNTTVLPTTGITLITSNDLVPEVTERETFDTSISKKPETLFNFTPSYNYHVTQNFPFNKLLTEDRLFTKNPISEEPKKTNTEINYSTFSTILNENVEDESEILSQETLTTSIFEFYDDSNKYGIQKKSNIEAPVHNSYENNDTVTFSYLSATTNDLYNISNDDVNPINKIFDFVNESEKRTSIFENIETSSSLNEVTQTIINNESGNMIESVTDSSGENINFSFNSNINDEDQGPFIESSEKYFSHTLKSNLDSSTPIYTDMLINNNFHKITDYRDENISTKSNRLLNQSGNKDENYNYEMTENVKIMSTTYDSANNDQTLRNLVQSESSKENQIESIDEQPTESTDLYNVNSAEVNKSKDLVENQTKEEDPLTSDDSSEMSNDKITETENIKFSDVNHKDISSPTQETKIKNLETQLNGSDKISEQFLKTINVTDSYLDSTDSNRDTNDIITENYIRFDYTSANPMNYLENKGDMMTINVLSEQQPTTNNVPSDIPTGTSISYVKDNFNNDYNESSVNKFQYDEFTHMSLLEKDVTTKNVEKLIVTTTDNEPLDRKFDLTDYKSPLQDNNYTKTTAVSGDHDHLLTTEMERYNLFNKSDNDIIFSELESASDEKGSLEELTTLENIDYNYTPPKRTPAYSEDDTLTSNTLLTTPFIEEDAKAQENENDEQINNVPIITSNDGSFNPTTINPTELKFLSMASPNPTPQSIDIKNHLPEVEMKPTIFPTVHDFLNTPVTDLTEQVTKFQSSESAEKFNIPATLTSVDGSFNNYEATVNIKDHTFLPISSSPSITTEADSIEVHRPASETIHYSNDGKNEYHLKDDENSKPLKKSYYSVTENLTEGELSLLSSTEKSQNGSIRTTNYEWNTEITSKINIDPVEEFTQATDYDKVNSLNLRRRTTTVTDGWDFKGPSKLITPLYTPIQTDGPVVTGPMSTYQIDELTSFQNRLRSTDFPFTQTKSPFDAVTDQKRPGKSLNGVDSLESSYEKYYAPATKRYSYIRRHIKEKYVRRIGNCARIRNNIYKPRSCK